MPGLLPEDLWSETRPRMCPGSPLMLKHAVSLLSGNSTTKWGSPSANGERGQRFANATCLMLKQEERGDA